MVSKKESAGYFIVNNNNTFRLDVGYPCFQYLTVDKPAVNSNQNYIKIFRQMEPSSIYDNPSLI